MFKVVIAGGRDYINYPLLRNKCLYYLKDKIENDKVVIVSGNAKGADQLGEKFAEEFNLEIELHPADWDGLGRSAGYIRNEEMIKVADAVICFWDGESRGTGHMIAITQKANKPLRIVYY